MATELQAIVRFRFHDGDVEEFKRLSARCMEIVLAQDTGTLQYDTYFNDHETECIDIERFRDSEALIQHSENAPQSPSTPARPARRGPIVGRATVGFVIIQALRGVDFSAGNEPEATSDLRGYLERWLDFQRHEFLRKLRDMTPQDLVAWSVPPLQLSVLGLVRHMTQMEHVYVSWGLGGGEQTMMYGDDDYAGGAVETVEEDLLLYFAELERSHRALAQCPGLDTQGMGHGRPVATVLVKMIDEYALHAGQAHMLRFAALGDVRR